MKVIKKIIKSLLPVNPKKAFYAIVKCDACGEEVKVMVNRSSDFQLEYIASNPEHCYTIKKEIIGKTCFNLMHLQLALDKSAKVLFFDTKGCRFIGFGKG